MISRLVNGWFKQSLEVRTRWRWIGYALTAAALLYLAGLLLYSELWTQEIDWRAYAIAGLLAIGIYLLSLMVQFLVWARLLSFHHRVGWRDVQIYSQMILMRRLPGGVWHWIGSTAMYSATTNVSARTALLANFWQWSLLILVAIGVFTAGMDRGPIGLRILLTGLAIGTAIALAMTWQPSVRPRVLRLAEAGLWTALYAVAWFLGGTILYLFVKVAGGDQFGLLEASRVWAVAGGVSLLVIVVPSGLGIREITLTWLLRLHLAQPTALLVALLLRLVFTLADVIWGFMGWALSHIVLQGRASRLSHKS